MAERGRSKRGDETVTAELEWHRSRAPPYRSKSNHIRAELCGSLVVLCRSRLYRYFFLVTSGSAQTLASCHPTSVIFERFKCASDLGGGCRLCPGGPPYLPRSKMFHAVWFWLVCCHLCPFIRLLISWHPLAGRTPAEFDCNPWPSSANGCDMPPCLKRIPLSRTGLVRAHPPDGCLRICV